jgi:hypothetical protein
MNGKINKGKGISLGRSHSKTGVAEATNAVAAIAEESHKFHSWEYVKSIFVHRELNNKTTRDMAIRDTEDLQTYAETILKENGFELVTRYEIMEAEDFLLHCTEFLNKVVESGLDFDDWSIAVHRAVEVMVD